MVYNLVRIQAEVFRKGAKAAGAMIQLYKNPPDRFLWAGGQPDWHMNKGELVFDEDAVWINLTAMGLEMDGVTLGDIDFMASLVSLKKIFGDDILMFAEHAKLAVAESWGRWSAIALYSVDVEQYDVAFEGFIPMDNTLKAIVVPSQIK